jgi:GTP-binding protein
MAISAAAHTHVRELLWKASELLQTAPVLEDVKVEMPVYKPAEDPKTFTIERTTEGWQVHGVAVERAAAMTYWEYDGSVRRFQRLMATLGIEDELRKAGVQEGETVFIGDYELEWQD